MAVPNQTPYTIFTANGITTVFPYEFLIFNASDLAVSINGTVVTSGYTVAGAGNISGGTVTFLTPPASGATVMLARVMPLVRVTEYQDNGDLLAGTVNQDFDRIWIVLQGQALDQSLALRRPWFNYDYYKGYGYRIAEIADPVSAQDVATKNYVDITAIGRTLRVPESFIPELPNAGLRANRIQGYDSVGSPIMLLPESGSAAEVLLELASLEVGKGDALIGVKQPFTGTIGRTQHSVNSERRSVLDFPGTWDGVADDTAGFQAAVNSFGLIGGTLHIPNIAKVFLATSPQIPGGVNLVGDNYDAGVPGSPAQTGNLFLLGGSIKLAPTASLRMKGGNTITGVVITPSTITAPQVNAANFIGTAIIAEGEDVTVAGNLIVGFNMILSSVGFSRQRVLCNGLDGQSVVYIEGAGDPPKIMNNHFWPYGTASASGIITTPDTNHFIYRSGRAISLKGCAWPVVDNNFMLGNVQQIFIDDCSNPRITSNGNEGINLAGAGPLVLGFSGIQLEGTTNNAIIHGNVAVHLEHGVYINPSVDANRNTVTNQTCRNVKNHGVYVVKGHATIQANVEGMLASSSGIRVGALAGKVVIDDCQLFNNAIGIQANGTGHRIGKNVFIGNTTDVYETAPQYAIAAVPTNLPITSDTDYYYVTGSVSNMSSFKDTFNGHVITLTFASACTLVTGGNLGLSSASVAVGAARTIQFICLGGSGSRTWRQLGAPI